MKTAQRNGERAAVDRRALLPVLVLAFAQDAVNALVFLCYMNHYLLVKLHASAGLPGYTLALYGAVKFIALPVAGRVVDAKQPRFVLRTTLALQLSAAALLLVAHSLPAFLAATVLLAAGSAMAWPLIYATVARTQDAEARCRATGALAMVGYGATAFGFVGGVLLSHLTHAALPFWLAAALLALPVLLQGCRCFAVSGKVDQGAESDGGAAGDVRPAGVRLFGAVIFLDFAALTALAGVYGPFTRVSLHLTLLQTSILLVPAGLAGLASLQLAARSSRPERRMQEMALLYGLAAFGALGLAVAPAPLAALLAATAVGAGAGGIAPIVAASLLDLTGGHSRGRLIGTLMAVEGIGTIVGPAAVATMTDLTSPRGGMLLIGAIFLTLVGLTSWSARRWSVATPATAAAATEPISFPALGAAA